VGDGDFNSDKSSWQLVRFIRHLPEIAESELTEMRKMNPKGAHEIAEEEAIRDFLSGGAAASGAAAVPSAHGGH